MEQVVDKETILSLFGSTESFLKKHIHFVGIKGTGMAALVEICAFRGAFITGSDVSERFYTDEILEKLEIKATVFDEKNITNDIDVIVYSSAYSPDTNPELNRAKEKGIPFILYTEALGSLSFSSYSCGIAGVHGKTSTTALCGTILKETDLPTQVLAGSLVPSFSSEDSGSCTLNLGKDYFIAETCEYQRHFMHFHPKKIILTSVESDHQDYYPLYEDIRQAFIDYCCLLPMGGDLIFCCDDEGAFETALMVKEKRADINLIPYGFSAKGDFCITSSITNQGEQTFFIEVMGDSHPLKVYVPGKHTLRNAAASIALILRLLQREYKKKSLQNFTLKEIAILNYDKIEKGLASFVGSRRRSELIGNIKKEEHPSLSSNVTIVDDYAHHPTALKTTLQGLKDFYPDSYIIVDFMSHTYSRTVALFDSFASSFGNADMVLINTIYGSARETYNGTVSGELLCKKTQEFHKNASYAPCFEDAVCSIKKILESPLPLGKKDFLVVTMGAGDNWKIGKSIFDFYSK